MESMTDVNPLATFDFAAFFAAVDNVRLGRKMGWYDLAADVWEQSAQLNAERQDHPLCGGAVSRLGARGETSCQYALYLLRWLGKPPEEFLTGPVVDVGDMRLADPGPDSRLRFDLAQLHAALNEERQRQGLTWAGLAAQTGSRFHPSGKQSAPSRTALGVKAGQPHGIRLISWQGPTQQATDYLSRASQSACRRSTTRSRAPTTTSSAMSWPASRWIAPCSRLSPSWRATAQSQT